MHHLHARVADAVYAHAVALGVAVDAQGARVGGEVPLGVLRRDCAEREEAKDMVWY